MNGRAGLSVAIVGRGRVGTALAHHLSRADVLVHGPFGRDVAPRAADVTLLCVPDSAIAAAALCLPSPRIVGHCSGATPADVLPTPDRFSLHPMTTIVGPSTQLRGVGCAISASTAAAGAAARCLADVLEMRPFALAEEDRATYHAALSIASNYLLTLEGAAERLLELVDVDRDLLLPMVRATVDNWVRLGARKALTGPVARGDASTVERQRTAIATRAPDLLPMFDSMTDATRVLAHGMKGVCA